MKIYSRKIFSFNDFNIKQTEKNKFIIIVHGEYTEVIDFQQNIHTF